MSSPRPHYLDDTTRSTLWFFLIVTGVAVALTLSFVALLFLGSGTAGAAGVPELSWGSSSVSLITPADCDFPVCAYELYVNEPFNGNVVIGTGHGGPSQVISVAIPPFCGTVQADIYKNGRYIYGHRRDFETCPPPTTTTTTPPTTVPPTTVPPTTTPPTVPPPPTTVPPVRSTLTPVTPPAPAAPVTVPAAPATSTPPAAATPSTSTSSPKPAVGPVLAYTGINWLPLLGIGLGLLGLGGALMRRRVAS